MRLPEYAPGDEAASIAFRLADVDLRVAAPPHILAVLDTTLSHVPRSNPNDVAGLTIEVIAYADAWEIRNAGGSTKLLPRQSAPPQIAGAVVTSAVAAVAASRECTPLRATVVERDGRALAMVGDDWESTIALATHLHSRGWSYVGGDNVVLDAVVGDVYGVQKSLYVNSSSVSQLPLSYRRAVEASPWYVTPQGIAFYAVDPSGAGIAGTWTRHAALCGLLVIDGSVADMPSLVSLERRALQNDRLVQLGLDWGRLSAADLCIAGPIETCDLIEHWFSTIST